MTNDLTTRVYAVTIRDLIQKHGSISAAARHENLPRKTLANRYAAAKRRYPDLFTDAQLPPSKNAKQDPHNLRVVWSLYEASGYSYAEMARKAGVSEHLVVSRVNEAAAALGKSVTPEMRAQAATQNERKRTIDDEVALLKARETSSIAKARLKDAARKLAALQSRLDDLEAAARSTAEPATWTIEPRRGEKSEHIPYLFTSDFQVGEVIDIDEMEGYNSYSTEIFQSRYRRLIEKTIYLSFEHVGDDWQYPGIIYARGGDTISGGIHDELRETDDMTPIEACEVAFEAEAWGLLELAKAFGKVDVKDCGGGNHDRDTMKGRAKKATAHSYDRLISYMLRREFKNDPRISFQGTKSPDVIFPIYNKNILLTHGDKIGSRGGQGFIGPAATVMRGAQRVIGEQAKLGRIIDRVDMGHFHTPFYYGWVMVNGCLPGYNEYAKSNRLSPSDPEQYLLYHHAKHGVVDIKPINLAGE